MAQLALVPHQPTVTLKAVPASTAAPTVPDDGIVLKLATKPRELEAAFRLVYESYLRAGLTSYHPGCLRVTPYQLQESSEVFIAVKEGIVISTASLIGDGPLGLPMEDVFGAEVDQVRRLGMRIAEVSCLSDRRESVERSMPMLLRLMRLLGQHSVLRGIDRLLIAVHPRHARYYKRLIGFQQVGVERQYSAVLDHPAVALFKDLDYSRSPNTKVFNSFFEEPCPRNELVRESPRPSEFVDKMWSLVNIPALRPEEAVV